MQQNHLTLKIGKRRMPARRGPEVEVVETLAAIQSDMSLARFCAIQVWPPEPRPGFIVKHHPVINRIKDARYAAVILASLQCISRSGLRCGFSALPRPYAAGSDGKGTMFVEAKEIAITLPSRAIEMRHCLNVLQPGSD